MIHYHYFMVAVSVLGLGLCIASTVSLLCDRYSADVSLRLRELQGNGNSRSPEIDGDSPAAISTFDRKEAKAVGKKRWWISDGAEERKRHQSMLIQAGIYNPVALFAFLTVRTGLMVIPPVAGLVAAAVGKIDIRVGLLWGATIGLIGLFLPWLWLERKVRVRHLLFNRSLADFLDLMIVCLESGLSLQGTIQRVSEEMRIAHPEFAGELSIVQRDVELGTSIDNALRRFATRSGCDGVASLAKFVRETQRFGTVLTEGLRAHADSIRSQRELAAEEMAQKAAVKILMPTLLLILPATFIVIAGPAMIQIQNVFTK